MASSKQKKTVSYFYDGDIGNYYYGAGHPMKPHRIRMAHNLLLNYGLYRKMHIYVPNKAQFEDMTKYHSDEYVKFLRTIHPENQAEHSKQMTRFNVGEDSPVFDGMYEFCQLSAGGSLAGAAKLNSQTTDIAINWAGGLHHAKKSEASGFCYINDIVLGILELLKRHQRVLYIDIDIHHGDGVEEAFYTTDRVMTVSFHKYGEYFPGTGDIEDVGAEEGKNYALNFPLRDGIDDKNYEAIFKAVMEKVMLWYDPGAIVLQCGADSLSGDRLGCFNLSLNGHAACVEYMKSFNKPLLLLGGGGYTIRNVARCWTYETAIALDATVEDELPYNDYFEYFGPDFRLSITPSNMDNLNSEEYLNKCVEQLVENLRHVKAAPSIDHVPLVGEAAVEKPKDEADPDVRKSDDTHKKATRDEEIDASDDEGDATDHHTTKDSKPSTTATTTSKTVLATTEGTSKDPKQESTTTTTAKEGDVSSGESTSKPETESGTMDTTVDGATTAAAEVPSTAVEKEQSPEAAGTTTATDATTTEDADAAMKVDNDNATTTSTAAAENPDASTTSEPPAAQEEPAAGTEEESSAMDTTE